MKNAPVSFEIADLFVMNGPLLDEVEAVLKTLGQDDLAGALNKIQMDAGVFVFEGIGDGRDAGEPVNMALDKTRAFLETPNPETLPPFDPSQLERTKELLERVEPLNYARLAVLPRIGAVLDEAGASCAASYQIFAADVQAMVPANGVTGVVPCPKQSPF